MNPRQIQRVQETFEHIAPMADLAVDLFYQRLFELDPSMRQLFKGDMRQQKVKLIETLSTVARGLHQLEELIPLAEHLGRRHVAYGVKKEHYQTFGAALLWTLEQGLGDLYTPEVEAAWTAAYDLFAGVMQNAAAEVEPIY